MSRQERALVVLLRIFGCTSMLAIYAVLQPHSWMAATHEWLGLGTFPEQPIAAYLARSLSAFYALLGGALLLFSTDLRRYRPPLVYVSGSITILGVVLFFIDRSAGLPASWTWWEGPFVTLVGGVMSWLVRSVPSSENDEYHSLR